MLGHGDPNLQASRQHRSFDSMSGVLGWLLALAGKEVSNLPLSGSALEVGTGQFLTHAAGLYVCGFDRVLTVDRYRQFARPLVQSSMDHPVLARRFLSPFASHDQYVTRFGELEATDYDPAELARIGVEYRAPLDVVDLRSEPERFDLIFSYTVLEHVPLGELPGLLTATSELLAPGGVVMHFVDLEDHLDPRGAPFDFLAPAAEWGDAECGTRGNRVRFSHWESFFADSGELKWRFPYVPVRHDAPLPETIDPTIRHTDEADLRRTAFVAVAQAPLAS